MADVRLVNDFSAVVLAGGRSSRMGNDKALLPFGGHRLLEHQLATLRATGATEIFVSAREAEQYSWAGVPIVCDEIRNAGPLSGLCATLRRCPTLLLLALAVDLPLMTAWFLQDLVALSRSREGRGVIVLHNERFEPLAALYPVSSLPSVEERLAKSQLSMQALVRDLINMDLMTTRELRSDELSLFSNFNRPADISDPG